MARTNKKDKSKKKMKGNDGSLNAPRAEGTLPVHSVQARGMVPRIISGQGTSIRIRNTELLTGYQGPYDADVSVYSRGAAKGAIASGTSGAIANANYGSVFISPGAFQWLKTIASGYSKYKFHRIQFHLRSQVGTQTAGLMSASVVHDAEDLPVGGGDSSITAAVTRISQNENYVSGPVWSPDLCLDYDGKNSIYKSYPNTGYDQFVIATALAAGTSGTYPLSGAVIQAALIWAVENTTASNFVGRIFATYDVELSHPVAPGFSAT
jgi:hypothetical protein